MKVLLAIAVILVSAVPAAVADPAPAARARAPATAAPHTAKAVLQDYVAAWNRHDPKLLDALLDARSVHEDVPAGFSGTGPAAIKAFAAEIFKAQPDLVWRLTTIVESGSTVAAEWTWTATYTGDGPAGPVKHQRISARGSTFATVENGRIRHFIDYYDFASAFPPPAGAAK